jgi:CRISPR-associated protein Csm3
MFRVNLNRARLSLRLETRSPLRVGAGDIPLDPSAADAGPVRTRHGTRGTSVYVPGSSLKGVLRSSAELRLRERPLRGSSLPPICDPLRLGCALPLVRRRLPPPDVHRGHCPICRLFGSAALRSRICVRDAFPWRAQGNGEDAENTARANRLELRHRLSIDRRSGTVAAGPFESEVVPVGAVFYGEILLENYQVWQLGLLVSALDDFSDGFAQLGGGKSEGFGQLDARIESILHEQASSSSSAPAGVGALARSEEGSGFGLLPEAPLPPARGEPHGLAARYEIRDPAEIEAWLAASRGALGALL